MQSINRSATSIAIGMSTLVLASTAFAQPNYSVEQVQFPGTISTLTFGYLNDSNQIMISNSYDDVNGNTHYLIDNKIQVTPFTDIYVRDMNDQGQVVGSCTTPNGDNACIWSKANGYVMLPGIQQPEGYITLMEGRGINDSGQVAGYAFNYEGTSWYSTRFYGYVWDSVNGTQLLGNGWANVIADDGAVQFDNINGESVLWKDGQIIYNDVTSAYGLNSQHYNYSGSNLWDPVNLHQNMGDFNAYGSGNAINNSNQIAGYLVSTNHAAIWDNGTVYDLNDLIPANSGWVLEKAHDINESAQVIGKGTLNGVDAIFLLSLPQGNTPPQYSITTFDIDSRAVPKAINSSGKVVGYIPPQQSGRSQAFSWDAQNGLYLYGYYHSQAHSINDAGAVGGNSGGSNVRYQTTAWKADGTRVVLGGSGAVYGLNDNGFATGTYVSYGARLWNYNTGQNTLISSLGGTYTYPLEINNSNIVVGYSQTPNYQYRAFIYDEQNGTRELSINATNNSTYAYDINDSGEIVAKAYTTGEAMCNGWCSYVSDAAGNWSVLPSFDPATGNVAVAINEQSQMVGSASSKAATWVGGAIFDLNDYIPAGTTWNLSNAVDISENGQIVGTGTLDGVSKIFVLTPIQ